MRGTDKGKKEYLDLLYCIIYCRYVVLVLNDHTDLILNRAPYVLVLTVFIVILKLPTTKCLWIGQVCCFTGKLQRNLVFQQYLIKISVLSHHIYYLCMSMNVWWVDGRLRLSCGCNCVLGEVRQSLFPRWNARNFWLFASGKYVCS